MGVWSIVVTVVIGWTLLSVLTSVVLGHLIAGKPMRRPSVQDSSVVATVTPLRTQSFVDAAF